MLCIIGGILSLVDHDCSIGIIVDRIHISGRLRVWFVFVRVISRDVALLRSPPLESPLGYISKHMCRIYVTVVPVGNQLQPLFNDSPPLLTIELILGDDYCGIWVLSWNSTIG